MSLLEYVVHSKELCTVNSEIKKDPRIFNSMIRNWCQTHHFLEIKEASELKIFLKKLKDSSIKLKTLRLFGHGSPGQHQVLDFKNSKVFLEETLLDYADLMQENSRIYVEGCKVGSGCEGKVFLYRLAKIFYIDQDKNGSIQASKNYTLTIGPLKLTSVDFQDVILEIKEGKENWYKRKANLSGDTESLYERVDEEPPSIACPRICRNVSQNLNKMREGTTRFLEENPGFLVKDCVDKRLDRINAMLLNANFKDCMNSSKDLSTDDFLKSLADGDRFTGELINDSYFFSPQFVYSFNSCLDITKKIDGHVLDFLERFEKDKNLTSSPLTKIYESGKDIFKKIKDKILESQ